MACANTLLSIFAIVNFLFVVWPKFAGAYWVILITSILTLIVAWTMVDCRACKRTAKPMPRAKPIPKKKATRKRKKK